MSKYKSNGILNFQQVDFLGKYMAGGFVAGGCFKNILNGEKVKDIDVYFEKRSDYDNAKDYYDNKVNSGNYLKSYANDKVTAYYDEDNDIRIELIKSVFGDPQEVIEQFDFTITKFAYYKEEFEDEDTGEDSIS